MAQKDIVLICRELGGPFETYINGNLQDQKAEYEALLDKQKTEILETLEKLEAKHQAELEAMYGSLRLKAVKSFMYDQDYKLTDKEFEQMSLEFRDLWSDNFDVNPDVEYDRYTLVEDN